MLFRRLFLCALLVGVCSGLLHAALQRWQVLPLILAAEVYESAADEHGMPGMPAHDEPAAAATAESPEHEHHADEWQPADGVERTSWTIVANILAATGYALLLLPLITLWDRSRGGAAATWRTGLAWGACAWLAAFALPGLGLPPELPGVGAAALRARQAWWLLAIVCSAIGLAALFLPRDRKTAWRCAGVALLALPLAIGAPQPEVDGFSRFGGDALVQMHVLSAQFVRATSLATAIYWLSLGLFSSLVVARWVRPFVASLGLGATAAEGAL